MLGSVFRRIALAGDVLVAIQNEDTQTLLGVAANRDREVLIIIRDDFSAIRAHCYAEDYRVIAILWRQLLTGLPKFALWTDMKYHPATSKHRVRHIRRNR